MRTINIHILMKFMIEMIDLIHVIPYMTQRLIFKHLTIVIVTGITLAIE